MFVKLLVLGQNSTVESEVWIAPYCREKSKQFVAIWRNKDICS